jgi:hypothetical protein
MTNFLSPENLDNVPDDSTQVRSHGRLPNYATQTYSAETHLDDLRLRRTIRRMKILTAISLTVTLTILVQRFGGRILNHNRSSQTSEPTRALPQTNIPLSTPARQNAPQGPVKGSLSPENLPGASKEEVMSAIREPIRDMDLPRTSNLAKTGDMDAQYEMGLRSADGNGVPQDYAEAMRWFTKASERGSSEAQLKLGLGYMKGIGVPYDENQAVMWLKRAANSGNIWAQKALSNLYLRGYAVPKDYVRAYTWAKIASELEGKDNDELRTLGPRISQTQIASAERRISIWNRAHQNSMDPLR